VVKKLESYLVQYTDGENREQVRVCLIEPTTKSVFVVQENISRTPIVTNATEWFKKALLKGLELETSSDGKSI
jgi:hypothetical protein